MESKFMTIKEVAELLQLNKMTLYRYVKAGKIEAYKVGKDLRIRREDFEKFLETIRMGK
jgi:putative molybdopterin biosynthesis protein